MKVLICGAGIAGPTLAYWLVHYGIQPTLIERAPALRTGGYVIDFWGVGYDIAERMGLLPQLARVGYRMNEVRVVDRNGDRVAGFPASAFSRATRGRYTSLARSDLSAAIFHTIDDKAETIFGDSVERLEQNQSCVRVTLQSGATREFDLVIGADGLHSQIRKLVFGPEQQFEKYLGYKVAAFQAPGYRPRDELVYMMYTQVGQQVGRFSMRDDRTMFLFTYADDQADRDDAHDPAAQRAALQARFGNSGWECPQILDALDRSDDLYFDRVSQIRMESWSRGRVALLGDAASCVSLLAGQGSALAMAGAFILAGELHRAQGDYAQAFARYEALFHPFVAGKQKAALRFAGSFAPASRFSLWLRNKIMNWMRIPWIADLAVGRDLADRITLPEYP